MRLHRPSHRTAKPLVNITENDAGSLEFVMIHNHRVEEPARLPAMFEACRPQVDIEYMKQGPVEADISPETAPWQTAAAIEIVMTADVNWEASENDVSVFTTLQPACLAKR